MNQLNRISLGISATIFTIIGIVLFINPIEHIGSFSWLISCGFFLISLSRFSRYYRLRQAGIIQQQQLFHSMVALVFAVYLLLYGYKTLPIVFPVTLGIWLIYRSILNFRKANFYSRNVEELSKRYIFFALLQLFIGLFLIVSPLSISVFLLNIIGLIFLILGFQSFSLLFKSFEKLRAFLCVCL